MPNYFFTADTHYLHSNVIKHCKRPQFNVSDFDQDGKWLSPEIAKERVEAMNEMLIEKHNSVVKPGDIVYHLGDFCFSKEANKIFNRLNGNLHLILGNHDEKMVKSETFPKFAWIKPYYRLKLGDRKIILCHYPFARWDCIHYGSFHLHGHCHGSYQPVWGKILDVGVDRQGDYRPWSYEEICTYMEGRNSQSQREEKDLEI